VAIIPRGDKKQVIGVGKLAVIDTYERDQFHDRECYDHVTGQFITATPQISGVGNKVAIIRIVFVTVAKVKPQIAADIEQSLNFRGNAKLCQ